MGSLSLSSLDFDDGESIPDQYGYTESNINPPLTISGIPDGTKSLAIIMDDPDAMEPAGKIWDHWVIWNIDPDTTEIPADWDTSDAVEGENDYGEIGYGGPNPPDSKHNYHFKIFALDTRLDLQAGSSKDDLNRELAGHVLDQDELIGTYSP